MEQRIEGVIVSQPKVIDTPRGNIFHILKKSEDSYHGFGEVYLSEVHYNDVKGWTRHNEYHLNLVVVKGSVTFVIYDDREESSAYQQFQEVKLSFSDNYGKLTVAPGLWVAFKGTAEGGSMILNVIPDEHNPLETNKKEINEIPYPFQ